MTYVKNAMRIVPKSKSVDSRAVRATKRRTYKALGKYQSIIE